jgi:predicted O-methyltransferase YrrM
LIGHLARVYEFFGVEQGGSSPVEITKFERNALGILFAELGYQRGAEIGVARGVYSEILCRAIPELVLYCVDPYRGDPGYEDFTDAVLAQMQRDAHQRLKKYPVRWMELPSLRAAEQFKDRSLDFVYIDGDHRWRSVTQDIAAWEMKVRRGGILAGHDYYPGWRQVMGAVDGYVTAFEIEPWFLVGSKQVLAGESHYRARSWFWMVR